MSASPNCDSCGTPLRGEALFMARRAGELFFCPPCGATRERRHNLVMGVLVFLFILLVVMSFMALSGRVTGLETRLKSLEGGSAP